MEKKWETIEGFENYKAMLEGMEDSEKKNQQEELSHFLRIVNASLTKHFSMWASTDLIFLSVLLEQKIATVIVRYMYGMEYNSKEHCVGKMHNKTIDLKNSGSS